MKVTRYYRDDVMQRPQNLYLHGLQHRVAEALTSPIETRPDVKGRTQRFIFCPEDGHYLRVVVEPDGETVHNAFRDRRYKPPEQREEEV